LPDKVDHLNFTLEVVRRLQGFDGFQVPTASLSRRAHICLADALSPLRPALRAAPRIPSDGLHRALLIVTAQGAFPPPFRIIPQASSMDVQTTALT
jgi:hypothetical protein